VKNKFKGKWTEVVVAKFEILLRHLSGESEENHGKHNQNSCFSGQDLNPRPANLKQELMVMTRTKITTFLLWKNNKD
jgi:hypothetical protein